MDTVKHPIQIDFISEGDSECTVKTLDEIFDFILERIQSEKNNLTKDD